MSVSADWTDPGLAAIARLIEEETGLTWPAGRRDSAESAIFRAMERARVNSVERYLALIKTETAAREELIAELTIGETYFFRDANQFTALRDVLIPEVAAVGPKERELRVWSAGCASGEEPYSLAIALAELGHGERAHVLGTDIARHRLAAARTGRYTRWSLRGVAPATVERYFRQDGRHFHLHHTVRDAVDFRYLNLAEDRYPSMSSGIWGMDLVLCRNVLIYFDRETVAHVASRLIASLSETGWLMLGASDPPIAEYIACEVVVVGDGIAYRRADVAGRAATRIGFASAPHAAPPGGAGALPAPPFVPGGAGDPYFPARDTAPAEVPVPGVHAVDDAPAADAPPPSESGEPAARIAPAGPVESGEAHAHALDPMPPAAGAAAVPGVEAAPGGSAGDAAAAAYAARDFERAASRAAVEITAGMDGLDIWIVRVRSLANLGRLAEASRACSAALDRHGESAELNYLLAVLLVEAGRPADAAAVARQALYLDRSLVVAHLALADAAARAGDPAAARRSLRNAARLLEDMDPDAEVAASDGEAAGRMAELVRMRLRLIEAA